MKIMILGMGEIGLALEHVLKDNSKHQVIGWDKNASKIPHQHSLQDSLQGAELIFLCVPSWNLRGAVMSITPFLSDSTGIISLAKGIEKESHKTPDEILSELLPGRAMGVLGGPMIAEDILSGKLTSGVLASNSAKLKTQVKRLFKESRLRILTSSDVHGTVLCGVLKNTYTLSIGIAEGLGLGENAKGVLFSCALSEMRTLVKMLGGSTSTVLGLAGAGDFFATAMSTHSRNRMVGIALGTSGDGHLESEGFMSLNCIQTMVDVEQSKLPLLSCLIKIARKQVAPILLKEVIFGQQKA